MMEILKSIRQKKLSRLTLLSIAMALSYPIGVLAGMCCYNGVYTNPETGKRECCPPEGCPQITTMTPEILSTALSTENISTASYETISPVSTVSYSISSPISTISTISTYPISSTSYPTSTTSYPISSTSYPTSTPTWTETTTWTETVTTYPTTSTPTWTETVTTMPITTNPDEVDCWDGYAYDPESGGYNRLNIEACGCPDGYEPKGGNCCSADLHVLYESYIEGAWLIESQWSPDSCGGCPDGGVPNDSENVCCKGMLVWDGSGYTNSAPEKCGCPNGGWLSEDETTCCLRDRAYNPATKKYDTMNIQACGGCPGSGGPSENGTTCCYGGYAWDDATGNYTRLDISNCGCPGDSNAELINGVCCYDGLAWNENAGEYARRNDACGTDCPWDGELKNGVCCSDGLAWDDATGGYDIVDITNCGCPADSELKNGVCCYSSGYATNEFGETYAHYAVCGCPEGYELNEAGNACCSGDVISSGWVPVSHPLCGGTCPNGGEARYDTCCKNGKQWEGERDGTDGYTDGDWRCQ